MHHHHTPAASSLPLQLLGAVTTQAWLVPWLQEVLEAWRYVEAVAARQHYLSVHLQCLLWEGTERVIHCMMPQVRPGLGKPWIVRAPAPATATATATASSDLL